MKNSTFIKGLAWTVAVSSLSACNMEDYLIQRLDEVDKNDIEYVASGVLTRLDRFTVNGVEYKTDNAQVVIDDQPASQDQLAPGMYVTVEGKLDADAKSGTASKIVFENEIEGMVEVNNIATDGTLRVMGQTVVVDANTRFTSELLAVTSPTAIPANSFVEVSGYSSGKGVIVATRIEVKSDTYLTEAELQIKGTVDRLTDTSFFIGDMEIAYSDAHLEDFGTTQLQEGMSVEVKTYALPQAGLFTAGKVQLEDESHPSAHSGEIEGIVGDVSEQNSFTLNGHTIYIDGNTWFKNGSQTALSTGLKVEVEGSYDADGRFIANQVELKNENESSDADDNESEDESSSEPSQEHEDND